MKQEAERAEKQLEHFRETMESADGGQPCADGVFW